MTKGLYDLSTVLTMQSYVMPFEIKPNKVWGVSLFPYYLVII